VIESDSFTNHVSGQGVYDSIVQFAWMRVMNEGDRFILTLAAYGQASTRNLDT
jgi:hypothetical protein